jgi:hypothetical protein
VIVLTHPQRQMDTVSVHGFAATDAYYAADLRIDVN